ncbi:MAG: EAL domain-containing protein, partial [Chloroflexota bacterium]
GDGPELARAVVMLGATLGLETIAEGIEHDDQVLQLLDLGCVAGQGFLFSPARSLEFLTTTPFAARRAELRRSQAIYQRLTATGRFRAEDLVPSRSVA